MKIAAKLRLLTILTKKKHTIWKIYPNSTLFSERKSISRPLTPLRAVPTIVLVVITTFATFGSQGSGRIFGRTLTYTLSLMAGIGAPISIMGIILPIFTIIDMVETAENVWSDSCVCAMVNKSING